MMGPDEDLPTLIGRKDHLNILRYIRAHQIRDPDLVIKHGQSLLGKDLKKTPVEESARLAILEQIGLAALDAHNRELAEACLNRLRNSVGKDAHRFRLLLGRCLENANNPEEAVKIYDALLEENPANLMVLKRKYVMANTPKDQMEALNSYLKQNMSDTAAWNEMAELRLRLGDYKGAAFAMEEVVLGCPLDSNVHCRLGELYATLGGLDNLLLARRHLAQSLELNKNNRRAMLSLIAAANDYVEAVEAAGSKKGIDEHELAVAKELVSYGADLILKAYQGTTMYASVQRLMDMYKED